MNLNIREILDRYGIEYKSIQGTLELLYYCPFHSHSDDKMGSSRINEETGVYNCFACGEGGNIYKFVGQLENIDLEDAYKLLHNQEQSYDLDKLKTKKIRVLSLKASYTKLADSIINKILTQLISIGKKDFRHRWIIVCNYIKTIPSENLSQKHDELLNIYSEFLKEKKLI